MEGQSILGDRLTIGAHHHHHWCPPCHHHRYSLRGKRSTPRAPHHHPLVSRHSHPNSNSVTIIIGWGVEGHLLGVIDGNDISPNRPYQHVNSYSGSSVLFALTLIVIEKFHEIVFSTFQYSGCGLW